MSALSQGTESLQDAFTSLAEHAAPQADCPKPDSLWAAARGEASAGETRQTIEHTAACPVCAEAWRLAAEIGKAAARKQTLRPVVPRAPRSQWHYVTGVAAAVFLVLVGIQMRDVFLPAPVPIQRGTEAGIRSLVAPEPLSRTACRLQWSAHDEALHYDLLVTSEDLDTLVQVQSLEDPEFLIPEADLAGLPTAAKLLWRVEAVLPDGDRQSSKTFITLVE